MRMTQQASSGDLTGERRPAWVMTPLTAFVLRHRRWIVGLWLLALVAGGAAAGKVSQRLSTDFSLPGQPGYVAAQQIMHVYGNGGQRAPSILTVTVPAGETARSDQGQIAAAFSKVRAAERQLRIVDYGDTGDPAFITSDGRTTYALLFAPRPMGFGSPLASKQALMVLQSALPPGYHAAATGLAELQAGSDTKGPGVLAETLIGAAGALAVLAFVFGSLLALLPLLIAAVSIMTTFLITLGLTYLTSISFVVEFLIALVGLGVAIDYSLLVVTRWREERARGQDNNSAVIAAMNTSGRAVVFSGLTVGIGLVAVVVLPVPGLRSIGLGGMLIPLISVAVTTTLLPAILGGIGPRIDWPRLRRESSASRPWLAWGRLVVRHRAVAAAVAVGMLGLLIVPFFGMKVGETSPDALAKNGPAHAAYQQLVSQRVPSGVLTPLEVLVQSGTARTAQHKLAAVPGIATVAAPAAADSNRSGTTVLIAIPSTANLNSSASTSVTEARNAVSSLPGVTGIAGVGAIQLDYVHAVFGNFPLMLAVIAVLTLVLLTVAFRSVLLPVKAVVLNLVSLAATFGAITWFWQQGHGSQAVFSIPATGAITFWVPLMIFAFLFGLSMDYEVFILSRMREEYDHTGSTRHAVTEGLGRTGRLVTSAALILFLAFASLAAAPNTDIKVFATALGAGILLDATVVRALLVPATVALFGRWNWWLPGPLAKILPARPTEVPRVPSPVRQATHEQAPASVLWLTPEGDRAQPEQPVTSWPDTTSDQLR
jgi:RND superfamily putative drug exporter